MPTVVVVNGEVQCNCKSLGVRLLGSGALGLGFFYDFPYVVRAGFGTVVERGKGVTSNCASLQ